jgi:hypothetical protein
MLLNDSPFSLEISLLMSIAVLLVTLSTGGVVQLARLFSLSFVGITFFYCLIAALV